MARGQDLGTGRVDLLIPRRRQAGTHRRLLSEQELWYRRSEGLLPQGIRPRKVTLDWHVPSHRALRLLRRENAAWRRVKIRCSKYLNNIVEQGRRATKRWCAPVLGFKNFANAATMISGIELSHQSRKAQFALGHARGARRHSMQSAWAVVLFGVA